MGGEEKDEPGGLDLCFRAFSETADPALVSQHLRGEPTRIFRPGDVRYVSRETGKTTFHKTNGWLLTRYYTGREVTLSVAIRQMLDELSLDEEVSKQLRELGFEMNFYIGLFLSGGEWDFCLEPDLLRRLADLKVEFQLCAYP